MPLCRPLTFETDYTWININFYLHCVSHTKELVLRMYSMVSMENSSVGKCVYPIVVGARGKEWRLMVAVR